ncbi:PAS/PAC sensor hybrid histidine kinase [Jatrophihabitans endophyticus]|uniref:Sensor-like histidine kinase SenX3 n=1 Tax=Jatrophihabitans endophyticus TaxID=1206085 RepID=A0A1M5H6D6_9ACTN|nr:PAS domain-containing sensor histidine kinase [Jatrophihabitans endophyticus]SHG11557.1 PAS/PAC sensor hybrid histidine kinase [Jatrophihabitans endophyticus]
MTLLGPQDASTELALDLVSQVVDYAIIALDTTGTIRSWNAGAERLKGYATEEAVGRHFSIFYTVDDREADLPLTLLTRAERDGRVAHSGWRLRKDGTRFWGDVVITALHDESGVLTGYAKVTRDRTAEHALVERESQLRMLVAQVVDYAIVALDPNGVVLTWNAGAAHLKGYTADEAIGQHFSVCYTPDDRSNGLPYDLLESARQAGRVEHTGWRVRKDGSRFWGDVVLTALRDDEGRLTGYAEVTRDRTEEHRLERLQASLFATLTHDIRQPLHSIAAYASLVARAEPGERAHFAERITTEAAHLEHLITNLFDYAKLRAGVVSIDVRPLALGDVVREVVAANGHLFAGREIDVDDDGATALADRVAMRRVLANLLSNAVKYSPAAAPVEVTVAGDGLRTRLTVADHGRGIAPEDVPVIFTEFVRGQLASEDGGTGLGLASVKHLVELQHGSVHLDSRLGDGTVVVVDLPATSR